MGDRGLRGVDSGQCHGTVGWVARTESPPVFQFSLLALATFLLAVPAAAQITADRIASGLSTPIYATSTGDPNDPRLFIVEQGGGGSRSTMV